VTGYVMAFSPCLICKVPFGYNPLSVPSSSAVTGSREPICASCVARLNVLRVEKGLAPIVPAADAYAPVEEAALPL
jgi:hypothetical protein